jgi:hypothetical protein
MSISILIFNAIPLSQQLGQSSRFTTRRNSAGHGRQTKAHATGGGFGKAR